MIIQQLLDSNRMSFIFTWWLDVSNIEYLQDSLAKNMEHFEDSLAKINGTVNRHGRKLDGQ